MFYVYHLTDPRDGQPFYVGKGKGERIAAHETEARNGRHSAKCDRIREIWAHGLDVGRCKVSQHDCENAALQAEFDQIAAIGLDALTNVLPGGKLGQQVYLERLARAQARKAAKDVAFWDRSFVDLAPKFANFLKHKSMGNDYGAWIGDRWIDFSDALFGSFKDMVDAVGQVRAKEIMAPHGVALT